MSKDNGGPAFPASEVTDHNGDIVTYAESGMTLRDYFAAKAMQGYCAHEDSINSHFDSLASDAYELADAMLEERAKASQAEP